MAEERLVHALNVVRRRVLTVALTAGGLRALAAGSVLLLLFAWTDLVLDLPPSIRVTCVWLSLACGAGLLIGAAVRSFHGSTQRSVARRIDLASVSGGQVLSGVDLLHQFSGPTAAPSLSSALATIAVGRAAELAARVRVAAAAPFGPLLWPSAFLGGMLALVGVIALASPRLVATQWTRFTDPYGDHPPYSSIQFDVQPGDTRVVYGESLDVRATPGGGTVDQVHLTFRPDGRAEESVPMFPEPGGAWRATVSQVTAPGRYFVRAPGVRSRQFRFDLITVPELRSTRVRITPPAYTHLPPYNGPVPEHGIAGLRGTKIELWAMSNRPLSGGTITLTAVDQTRPSAPQPPVSLSSTKEGAADVSGAFTITTPGKLNLTIVDVSGQPSRQPYTTAVTVLIDERPFVRILEPKENAFATPDARLDVNIAAEDDYGISALQLFRGLNDLPETPANLPVPANQPTHLAAAVPFDLTEYGLAPGDIIKFYARVEDNDPDGPKGSESPVVMVHIISTEDFNRMAVAREGLETLEAKYAMAARRLETLDDQLNKLQEQLKAAAPDKPLDKQTQDAMRKLARQIQESAADIADAAKDELPFDIDKQFRKNLDEIAKELTDAAKQMESAGGKGVSAAQAREQLAQIRKKLGAKRSEFAKDVMQPLDNLDAIFPLIEDQARFVELWQRQLDLAERMKSIAAVNPDDPRVKARMRDLEEEQRRLRQDLNELLDDIGRHAARLPVVTGPYVRLPSLSPGSLALALSGVLVSGDGSEHQEGSPDQLKDNLQTLQETAFRFVRRVKGSGAIEQMNDAAADLGAFDGAHAAAKARQAADTLKKYISECEAMEGQGRSLCKLAFKPSICRSMQSTIDQLLAAEGMNPGNGTGAAGGFSQRRSTLRNTSLYGRIPSRRHTGGERAGHSVAGPGAANGAEDVAADRGGQAGADRFRAAGESDILVPPQYRQKVGAYFQRVADELGQD